MRQMAVVNAPRCRDMNSPTFLTNQRLPRLGAQELASPDGRTGAGCGIHWRRREAGCFCIQVRENLCDVRTSYPASLPSQKTLMAKQSKSDLRGRRSCQHGPL